MVVVDLISDISEFSYGFALTNEIVGWTPLNAAPVFPSLIEEGKQGGGYDLKLDAPGVALYLQFKRADCMTRASAKEIKKHRLPLVRPFYRFSITERNKSFQHTSLLTLDTNKNLVFYAAPRFHLISEINEAWHAKDIAARSIFVRPRSIGLIADDARHHVAYDSDRAFFCSEPREIEPESAASLYKMITDRVKDDPRPIRERLPEWLLDIRVRREEARRNQEFVEMIVDGLRADRKLAVPYYRQFYRRWRDTDIPPSPAGPAPDVKAPKELSIEQRMLREIAEEALYGFGAQLFVLQPSD
ncbi:hypothetical protein G6L89_010355 [Agrobacterium fabrum]|uniref:hypothetical protein n=1 Tax=Agrobacterium fabrum TaxID=1176649 RepID=UPI0015734A59|nr:hypothetical protein [Agrobacterium fabrum]NTB08229.1 hypothetical protein [Agrobacterium fabrum]